MVFLLLFLFLCLGVIETIYLLEYLAPEHVIFAVTCLVTARGERYFSLAVLNVDKTLNVD